jgi:hypothetical protein
MVCLSQSMTSCPVVQTQGELQVTNGVRFWFGCASVRRLSAVHGLLQAVVPLLLVLEPSGPLVP